MVDPYLGIAVYALFGKPSFDQSAMYFGPTPTKPCYSIISSDRKGADELVKFRAAQRWVTFNVDVESDHGLLLCAV